jgi:Homeodomain-like domain
MLTVETDTAGVEERLRSGRLACPGCAGVLAGWGRARARTVRGPDGGVALVPRRSRCTGCRATHVLLPVVLLVRRADTAVVIGAALVARTAGLGHRRIAERLGRPPGTVRGWLRRFTGRVEAVRVVFTLRCRALAPDPVLPAPAGSGWADAVAAVAATAQAFMARFSVEVPVWQVASGVSAGRLLSPGWPARPTRADQHELPLTWADLPQ